MLVRPGVYVFLRKMCELYEVVVYTASTRNYADKVLDAIDPERTVTHRLFRKHCTLYNCEFVKDLSQLGRDLKDVIIVDNSPDCYMLQPCNGIPISTWTNDKNDRELDKLSSILELLHKVDDVRDYLREVVRDNELDYLEAIRLLKGEILLDDVQRNPSAYWTSPRKKLLTSPERSRSQVKLVQSSDSSKERYNEPGKITLGQKFVLKPLLCETSKLKSSGDSCAALPTLKTLETTEEKTITPVVTITTNKNFHTTKQTSKAESNNILDTLNKKALDQTHSPKRDLSATRPMASIKSINKPPQYVSNKDKLKLPPRPTYKPPVKYKAPEHIKTYSSTSSTYLRRPPINSNKSSTSSYYYKPPLQVNVNRPSACPSYGKYTSSLRSSMDSIPQYRYSRPSSGGTTPSKAYGVYQISSSQGNWHSFHH